MKPILAAIALLTTLTGVAVPTAMAQETRTYALIVAHNGSVDEGVTPLQFADDDGARYYEIFSNLAQEAHLLTVLDADSQRVFPKVTPKTLPPTKRQLQDTVARLRTKIEADRKVGRRSELYLIFTGHGNIDDSGQGYLSLQDGKLERSALYREVLRPLQSASYTHLIIDACHAYFMVQSRGGSGKKGAWEDDRSGQTLDEEFEAYLKGRGTKKNAVPSTMGVILSTSGTAEVHEWSKLRGGVFSHQLRSGLLGGADVDGDQRVSYPELEAFLAAANAGVKNPKARISVFTKAPAQDVRHPLVRLKNFSRKTILTLDETTSGRYYIEDARGLRYADLHAAPGQQSKLVLLHEPVEDQDYFLRNRTTQARIALKDSLIATKALTFVALEERSRGAVEEAFRTSLFAVPFGPGFFAGYMASQTRYQSMMEETEKLSTTTEAPDETELQMSLHYGVSGSVLGPQAQDLGLGGVQHNFDLALDLTLGNGLQLGPFAAYGVSLGPEATGHRIAIGGQVAWRLGLSDAWYLTPRVRIAPQAVLLQGACAPGASTCGDIIGLRTEGLLTAGWRVTPGFELEVQGGWALDVTTLANLQGGQEQVFGSPFLGMGLRF